MHKSLYNLFLDMRFEIDKHKWIESEKINKDIGFEFALKDWISNHRLGWVKNQLTSSIKI